MLLSSDCCMYIILIWHAVMYGQHGARKPKISPRQEELGVTGAGGATGPSHNGSNSKQLIKIINSGRDRGATIRKGKGAKVLPLAKSKWNLLLDGVKLACCNYLLLFIHNCSWLLPIQVQEVLGPALKIRLVHELNSFMQLFCARFLQVSEISLPF